ATCARSEEDISADSLSSLSTIKRNLDGGRRYKERGPRTSGPRASGRMLAPAPADANGRRALVAVAEGHALRERGAGHADRATAHHRQAGHTDLAHAAAHAR